MATLYFSEWILLPPAERFAQELEDFAREKELMLAWKELDETRKKYPEYFTQTTSSSAGKMQDELARVYPSALRFFKEKRDIPMMQFLTALPKRLGLNEQLFMRLLPAYMFTQITKKEEVTALIHWYKTEHELFPERQAERILCQKRAEKRQIEEIYEACGLAPQNVFTLLQTPLGPERGVIMRRIYEAIQDPDGPHDFGKQTTEILTRARRAHDELRKVNI